MINQNLLTLRKLHNFTQEAVAEKINVSRQAIAKWESGETVPDIINCNALAKLYDVTIDDLLNYSESRTGVVIPPKGKHLLGTVTIGERGQIVIPKKAREVFNLKSGDNLVVLGDEEQGIALIKEELIVSFMDSIKSK